MEDEFVYFFGLKILGLEKYSPSIACFFAGESFSSWFFGEAKKVVIIPYLSDIFHQNVQSFLSVWHCVLVFEFWY